jgi:hypothetical protein
MANNYTKTMRQALEEARSFRDVATEGGPGSGPHKVTTQALLRQLTNFHQVFQIILMLKTQ